MIIVRLITVQIDLKDMVAFQIQLRDLLRLLAELFQQRQKLWPVRKLFAEDYINGFQSGGETELRFFPLLLAQVADDGEKNAALCEQGRTGLIMELPPYHKPHWKSLFGSVFSKMGNVLSRALRIIICISVIFWLLSYSADGNVANSIIYKVGTFIEPVTSLFGLPWQLFIAFVASAMGKEASLGVMASLFNTGSIWAAIEQSATVDTAALSTSMLSVISRPEALAFLFAFFFNMPCLMALTATTQETHSMKWTVRIALYYVLTALIMATIAYHVGLVIF